MWKWTVALILLAASVVALFLVLNSTGFINEFDTLNQLFRMPAFIARHVEAYRLGKERAELWHQRLADIAAREAEVDRAWDEIEKTRRQLSEAEWRLANERRAIEAKAAALVREKEALAASASQKERLRDLAAIYDNMNPNEAAVTLSELDDETVAHILLLLQEEQAAKILSAMGDRKALIVRLLAQ